MNNPKLTEILKYFGLSPKVVKTLTQGQIITLIKMYYASTNYKKPKA